MRRSFHPDVAQQRAIAHLLSHPRAALFMGMGLGKTASVYEALRQLLIDGASRGMLVVAPLRVCNLVWPAEQLEWEEFRWMRVANLRTPSGWKMLQEGSAHAYVLNYEMLPRFIERYLGKTPSQDWPFDLLVLDELTRAKNHKSKRIRAFSRYLSGFTRRWGLTGSPNPNSLMELFGQFRVLDDGQRLGKAFQGFRDRWFYATDYMEYDWKPRAGAEEEIYRAVADISLVLRTEDYSDIPATEQEDIEVSLPDPVLEQYQTLEKELLLEISEEDVVLAQSAAVLMNKLLQFTGGTVYAGDPDQDRYAVPIHDAKLQALTAYLEKHPEENLLIACAYRHERARIREHLGDQAEEWQGDATGERWNRGDIRCLVVDPRSVGHGLNLQKGGRTVIWMTLPWSRELYEQMIARVARRGQTQIPRVVRLVCPDTVDEVVVSVLQERGERQLALLQALMRLRKKIPRG